MIEIRNVSKFYGAFQVLKDCNASIARGEVVVTVRADDGDKRTHRLTLTPAGRALLCAALPAWRRPHAEIERLLAGSVPDRLRAFLLTVVVVDDLIGLLVIVGVYSGSVAVGPLTAAVIFYSAAVFIRLRDIHRGSLYFVIGACAWVALLKAHVDPVVTGLAIGLLALASPAPRRRLEEASAGFRAFREQPSLRDLDLRHRAQRPLSIPGGRGI